jgi:hypothetical protein
VPKSAIVVKGGFVTGSGRQADCGTAIGLPRRTPGSQTAWSSGSHAFVPVYFTP